MKKINLLYLITTFENDGPGNALLNLVRNLPRESYNIYVACLYRPGKIQGLIDNEGIKTFNVNQKGLLKGWLDIYAINKIRGILVKHHIDIIHTHLIRADIYGKIAAIKNNTPIIISTIHNLDFFRIEKKYLLLKLLDSYLSRYNDKIITVSNCVMEFTSYNQNIPLDKFVTIYNSINIERFKPLSKNNNKITVGFLGRLHKQKDLPTLLKAAAIINKTNPDIKFIIAGDGPEKKHLLAIIRKMKLEKTVTLVGYINNVNKEFFPKIDIFVLSSIAEGHPLVILEAMASGLPCVATNVGGIPETIIDGKSGFIVEKYNPLQLATKILEIANTPKLQENMGKKGREIVEDRFDTKFIVNNHHRLYKSLIKQ